MNRLKELLDNYYEILSELHTAYIQEHNQNLFQDLGKLKMCLYDCELKDSCLFYSVPDIKLIMPEIPSHTIPHRTKPLKSLEVTISVKNIQIQRILKHIVNPIPKLDSFNIVIEATSKENEEFISSWHLDKRIFSETYNSIEPEFHFTFGGYKMENKYSEENWDFGQLIMFRSPRIMHPPMDIILGIDFVMNQFLPREYSNIFIKNTTYQSIISEMKSLIWKPYALAFAKNYYKIWPKDTELTYDETFCKSIIG